MGKRVLNKDEVVNIIEQLEKAYPDAKCALDYSSTFQLVIAVMLSAQTTDVSVNKITPKLFEAYPNSYELSKANLRDVEDHIHSIGLYKNKAKNIIGTARMLEEEYGGEVPGEFDELCKLPGVGRKSANVILSECFDVQRIAVDTHVFRVANRIGLTNEKDVLKTEQSLMKRIPNDRWTRTHHLLIFHGRRCCKARKPECDQCPIEKACLKKGV